jgi:hypothetical protein
LQSFLAEGDFSGKPPTVTAAFLRQNRGLSPFLNEPINLRFGNEGPAGDAHESELALFGEPVNQGRTDAEGFAGVGDSPRFRGLSRECFLAGYGCLDHDEVATFVVGGSP